MPRKNSIDNDSMLACTLCRSGKQSISTLEKAAQRRVEWPTLPVNPPSFKESQSYTSIDDAFDTVMQFMNMTTRQCKRYYRSRENGLEGGDNIHWRRFHVPGQFEPKQRNPLQQAEDVKVEMAPGTYAITAGKWGAERDHTHVIHVTPGQTVDLTFGI